MLPGMSAIGGTFTTVGLVGTKEGTGSGTLVINRPSGYQAGDIFVAIMACDAISGRTWTGDTGWSERIDQNADPHNMRVATLVAGTSEPSSYTFTESSGLASTVGQILCFRGYSYDTIGASVATLTDSGNVAMTGITAAGGILIAAVVSQNIFDQNPTINAPSGMVQAERTNSFISMASFYKLVGAGATGTVNSAVTVDDPGNQSSGILIGLAG